MKKFNLEDYEGKFVMHCYSEKKANIFLKYLDSKDKKWDDGVSYLKNNKRINFKEDTCYCFNQDAYASIGFYRHHGYSVLEFDDFNWEERETKFKVNDRVRIKKEFATVFIITHITSSGFYNLDKKQPEAKYSDDDLEPAFKIGNLVSGEKGSFFENRTLKVKDIVNNNLVFDNLQGCILQDCARLVYSFVKDDMIEVSNNEINWGKRKFYDFDSELNKPFLAIDENGNTANWKYARSVQRYESYEVKDFQREWIGEKLYSQQSKYKIIGLNEGLIVLYNEEDFEYDTVPLSFLYIDDYKWTRTNKIFGKEV